SVLSIRWFGSRHVLHVPARRPFTGPEVRLPRAIGTVLAARYRAIFDPKQMLERRDLFRSVTQDKHHRPILEDGVVASAARRRAARAAPPGRAGAAPAPGVRRAPPLRGPGPRACPSGGLGPDADDDAGGPPRPSGDSYHSSQSLTAIKTFYRLCDGLKTLFLVN